MNAAIYTNADGYHVQLYYRGEEHDTLGPFDTHEDAEWCLERCLDIEDSP